MNRMNRVGLAVSAIALLFVISVLQGPIDKLRPQFRGQSPLGKGRETSMLLDTSLQFFGAAAMGLREVVAGALWVRADEFFHRGQYEPIVPLVRLVTWLDPHQIDVYSTGAWHLDYNFVDSQQRSDRRYIPPAIALLEEGIANNSDIYDLYFELGWTHYLQKIRDYGKAAEWIEKAAEKPAKDPNTGEKAERPAFVDRMLAHAYEKAGQFDKAERQWEKTIAQSESELRKRPKDPSLVLELDIAKRNLGMLLLRRGWRYGDMAAYEKGIRYIDSLSGKGARQKAALEGAKRNFAEFKGRGTVPHDASPMVDADFSVTWRKVKPKVIEIQGTLALLPAEAYKGLASECYTFWYQENQAKPEAERIKWQNGCRLRIVLADYDFDYLTWKSNIRSTWEIDKTQTIAMDEVMVRDGKFRITIDLSDPEDLSFYPFAKDKYRLLMWFTPQEAPDYIQDRIGWRGEGLTDKHCLDTTTSPGYRMIRKEFILRKSDII